MFLILKVYTCLGLLSNLEIQFNTISWKNYGVELGSYIVLGAYNKFKPPQQSQNQAFKLFVLVDFFKTMFKSKYKVHNFGLQ